MLTVGSLQPQLQQPWPWQRPKQAEGARMHVLTLPVLLQAMLVLQQLGTRPAPQADILMLRQQQQQQRWGLQTGWQ
jgi:hypothetical protein